MTDRDAYEVLGRQMIDEAMGVDSSGIISAVFQGAQAGLKEGEKASQKKWGPKDADKGGGGGGGGAPKPMPASQGSFFTAVHAGIPTWGWMVGGLGIAGGLYMLLRRGRRR